MKKSMRNLAALTLATGFIGLAAGRAEALNSSVALPFSDNYDGYTTGSAGTVTAVWNEYESGGPSTAWSIGTAGAVSGKGYNDTEGVLSTGSSDNSVVATGYSGTINFVESANFVMVATPGATTASSTRDGLLAMSDSTALSGKYYLGDYWINGGVGQIRIASSNGTFTSPGNTNALTVTTGHVYLQTLTGTYSGSTLNLSYNVKDITAGGAGITVTGTDTAPANGSANNLFGYRSATGPGGTQNSTFDNFSLTPEPSSLALLGLGSLGMLKRRRRGSVAS